MKTTTTIVLFASIFAIASAGVFGFSANSATTQMVTPSENQALSVQGHVEYKVFDDSGKIAAYMQGDNEVVNGGEDCVANFLFGVGGCEVTDSDGSFVWIGIGNGTDTNGVGATNATLADGADGTTTGLTSNCAHITADGELARRLVTPSLTSAASGATGAIVVLETTSPFTFTGDNATDQTVMDSGIFNAQRAGVTDQNECNADEAAAGNWDMFSRQRLNGATGISVSEGDSLSVKWTITVG